MDTKESSRNYHTGNLNWNELNKHPFLFIQEHKKNYKSFAEDAIRGTVQPNLLNKVFFSKANMDIVQYRIKKFVYWDTWKQSGTHYIIGLQDETSLLVIMKYVYDTYAKHLPINIKEQIDELDEIVVKEAGPDVVSGVLAHIGYLNHINNPIVPVDRPQNLSSRGTRTLPSVSTILF
jgi:hypothetical protein